MAKYIRTKDGVYEVEKLNLNKIVGNIKYEIIDNKLFKTMYGYEPHLYESEIIKQSDNLADLRDEIVLTVPLQKPQILERNVSFEVARNDILNNNQQTVYDLYCCIWVKDDNCFPKLVPYAKMNMYGELVLI